MTPMERTTVKELIAAIDDSARGCLPERLTIALERTKEMMKTPEDHVREAWSIWRWVQPQRRLDSRVTQDEALREHEAWKALLAAWELLRESKCWRCDGSGFDPHDYHEDPATGAPEPAACRDCNGWGKPHDEDPCGGLP